MEAYQESHAVMGKINNYRNQTPSEVLQISTTLRNPPGNMFPNGKKSYSLWFGVHICKAHPEHIWNMIATVGEGCSRGQSCQHPHKSRYVNWVGYYLDKVASWECCAWGSGSWTTASPIAGWSVICCRACGKACWAVLDHASSWGHRRGREVGAGGALPVLPGKSQDPVNEKIIEEKGIHPMISLIRGI